MPTRLSSDRNRNCILCAGRFFDSKFDQRQQERIDAPTLLPLPSSRSRDVEEYLGFNISEKEWNLVRIHARYPGPFQSAPRTEIFRCRVNTNILTAMLQFLDDSENTQRLAFGETVRSIFNDGEVKKLDKVSLIQSVRATAVKFVVALGEELESVSQEEQFPDRCTKVEADSFRRCSRKTGHTGRCAFTNKSSISLTTATDLVSSLSNDELKQLSGLDNTKMLQGRDNFIRIRKLIDDLCPRPGGATETEEASRRDGGVPQMLFHEPSEAHW